MIGKPYLGLRRCEATVRVLFGQQRTCSNPATRIIADKLLCQKHSRGDALKVTIEFELNALNGTEAAKIALAVKRAIDTSREAGGPIVDTDGAVLGRWKAEHTKKRKAA